MVTNAYYDAGETQDPAAREAALFAQLRSLIDAALSATPALRRQLEGIAPDSLIDRTALQQVPVIRKSELLALQTENPPFAGLTPTRPGALKRLLVSPGPIFDPEGRSDDWWGSARALFASGMRGEDVVHNAFSYHLTPGGHMMEAGAHALGCAVIPAGVGNTEQQVEAITVLKPTGYIGTPDFLKILLDRMAASGAASPFRHALVSGAAFPATLQQEIVNAGIDAYQAYATAELGVAAYETAARSGLVVNEGLIVEIVRPGTNETVPDGDVGEVVVTRLSPEYPLLRFGTGDLSRVLPGPSACGRTNMRLAGWMGRADQRTKIKGMFVDPAQIAAIGRKFPALGRLRLVVSRQAEQDVMLLKAEAGSANGGLQAELEAALQAATKMRGGVEIVAPGTLPNDGKVIADERPIE
ncbi:MULTISPECIES: phenylacetate--CoA ligase family protein [Aminobacter]|uniref:AMP-dependent synthetase n=2 Tax=Aminobacter TaxID=31988 RepID=A0AAC8YUC7_AMIAI|nr:MULTISPECIES: AMP-binding protein [Aminobacter]AMS44546.1 AMP-dependent synthetase [Aminobacter aminovorans]MBA8906980.1 phenylacetate-CoA ligase [Aminobacter ciceronei]MBA9020762.1 phenylacetate-CoA ligase [Aminobacter ciceronei]MBB3708321.1 phenylacetate-CoA ligase [Aminobacter aminovorans]WMD00374.1 AMP-binding protein [Aminobacter niigataensis]